jgi:cell division protein FtsB
VAAAVQRARGAAAPRYDDIEEVAPSRAAYRAPRTRRRAAQRSRLTRAFVIFVACLTVLAVGRVALSFAVVQKSLQTDALVRQERKLSDENDRLQEQVAQASSTVNIRRQAETQLGLVDATHVIYLKPGRRAAIAEVAANR